MVGKAKPMVVYQVYITVIFCGLLEPSPHQHRDRNCTFYLHSQDILVVAGVVEVVEAVVERGGAVVDVEVVLPKKTDISRS